MSATANVKPVSIICESIEEIQRLGNTIATTITVSEDINRANQTVTNISNLLNNQFVSKIQSLYAMSKMNPREIVASAISQSKGLLKTQTDLTLAQLIQSATGAKINGSLLALWNKLDGELNGLTALNNACVDIPQNIIIQKARRYWNAECADNFLPFNTACELASSGQISWQYVYDMLRQESGLSDGNANLYVNQLKNRIGQFTVRDAWRAYKKGIVPYQYFVNIAKYGYGYSNQMIDALNQFFDYDFSLSELLRLSDLIPLEPSWVNVKLESLGLNSADKTVIKMALEKRALRDELSKIWSVMLDMYAYGLITKTYLTTQLASMGYSQSEINAKNVIADLLRTKTVVKLYRDAYIYLYRKGIYSETQLQQKLVAIGIDLQVANAIASNEAARQGLEWELPE